MPLIAQEQSGRRCDLPMPCAHQAYRAPRVVAKASSVCFPAAFCILPTAFCSFTARRRASLLCPRRDPMDYLVRAGNKGPWLHPHSHTPIPCVPSHILFRQPASDFGGMRFATISARSRISTSSRLMWFAASRSIVWQCGQATATVDTLVAMSPAKRSWFTLPLP